jgi:NADPH:quinone reductase
MRAMRIDSKTQRFELAEVPAPSVGAADVRIRVRAAGLNRADLLQLKGLYPAPRGLPPDIPGLEYAGEVLEQGPCAHRFNIGDRVMGIVGGGAFAEEVIVHEREVLPVPEGLSNEQAAALPEAFLTAYDALIVQAELRPSETVLLHAVASGVGTAALQIVHAWQAVAVGTSRRNDKLIRCRNELGLQHAIHIDGDGPPAFSSEVRRLWGGAGVDIALELVAGDYLPQTLASMAPRGRVMIVGALGGTHASVSLSILMSSRLAVRGTVLRSRPLEEKIALARRFEHEALPLFGRGLLRPVLDEVFPMSSLQEAAKRMQANDTFGKIVLTWENGTP